MRFFNCSQFVLLVMAVYLMLCSSMTAAGHRSYQRRHGRHGSGYSQHTRYLYHGFGRFSHLCGGQSSRVSSPPPLRRYQAKIVVHDACERIACYTHEDCAYSGCGGYYCFSCPTCEDQQPVLGACIWDPTPFEKACPKPDCPTVSPGSEQQGTQGTTSKEGGDNKSAPDSSPQATPGTNQPALPWGASFDGLRSNANDNDNNNKQTSTTVPADSPAPKDESVVKHPSPSPAAASGNTPQTTTTQAINITPFSSHSFDKDYIDVNQLLQQKQSTQSMVIK